MRYLPCVAFACLLTLLAGCGKKETLSPREAAVKQHLEEGGEFYFYADTSGGSEYIMEFAQQAFRGFMAGEQAQMAAAFLAPADDRLFITLASELGLMDVHAVGASSVLMPGGWYSNSRFFYMPEGRRGIFKATGGQPRSFQAIALATADTDLLIEADMDIGAMLNSIIGALKLAGSDFAGAMIDGWLSQPAGDSGMTIQQALDKLPTGAAIYLRLGEPGELPQPLAAQLPPGSPIADMKFPTPEVVIQISALDQAWIEMLKSGAEGAVVARTEGDITWYQPPTEMPLPAGISPAFAVRNSDSSLFLTSNDAWLLEMLASGGGDRLATSPDFKQAMAGLPADGNQLCYLSPRFFKELANVRQAVVSSNPMGALLFGIYGMQLPLLLLPPEQAPAAMVTANLEDGILTRANWPLQDSLYHSAMGQEQVVVATGLMAAMAIPAFNKVRAQSQEKAVMNNLRQIASAGQQYILSNGVPQVTYGQLVEAGYFNDIPPVAGEDYSTIIVSEEGGVIEVTLANGLVVEYRY